MQPQDASRCSDGNDAELFGGGMSPTRSAATTVELRPNRAPLGKRSQSAILTRCEQRRENNWARCVTDPDKVGAVAVGEAGKKPSGKGRRVLRGIAGLA